MDTLIIGAGGHGKVVLDILLAGRKFNPVGFLDADPALAGTIIAGLPVLGSINLLSKLRDKKIRSAIIAIGDSRSRLSCAQAVLASRGKLRRRDTSPITIIIESAMRPAGTRPPRNMAPTEAFAISA